MNRRLIRLLVCVPAILLGLLFCAVVSRTFAAFLFTFPKGWYLFLQRIVPAIRINWSGVALAGICTVLILGLIHFLGSVLQARSAGSHVRWPLRRTVTVFLSFCWLFILVMASSGLFRAWQWVLMSDEPLFVMRGQNLSYDLLTAEQEAADLIERDTDARMMRAKLIAAPSRVGYATGRNWWETFDFVVAGRPDGSVKQIVIFPRDKAALHHYGGVVVRANHEREAFTEADFQKVIAGVR